jgi:hypothetical protein
MTREPLLPSRLDFSPAADGVLLPNRGPTSSGFTGSIDQPRSAAVVAALTSSPRQAIGDVTAIHASANFSDPRRHASLRRFTSPDAVSQQPRERRGAATLVTDLSRHMVTILGRCAGSP